MIKKLLLPLLFLSGSFFVHAQSAWTIYNTANSLLPQNTVRALGIDAANNKWVGTDNGLAKFDGAAWTIYNTGNSGLPDNSVRAIAIDSEDNKWIGTLGGGIARFDGSTWMVYNTSNTPLPSGYVRAIAFDTAGAVWMGTSSGLVKFDGTNWQVWNINNSTLISNHVTSIAIGKNNVKYLGTMNGGLVYFNDTAFTFYNHWDNTLPDNTVLGVALDTSGYRWIAMPSGGLMAHYGGGSWQLFDTQSSAMPTDALNAVYVDSTFGVYMGSQNKGLIIKQGFAFTHYDSTNSPVPDDNVYCVNKDRNGVVWLGTNNGGLVRLDESILNSVEEQLSFSRLEIYPSAIRSGESIVVEGLEGADMNVYDGTGRLCLAVQNLDRSHRLSIHLQSGLYHIVTRSKAEMSYAKLVVLDR